MFSSQFVLALQIQERHLDARGNSLLIGGFGPFDTTGGDDEGGTPPDDDGTVGTGRIGLGTIVSFGLDAEPSFPLFLVLIFNSFSPRAGYPLMSVVVLDMRGKVAFNEWDERRM